MIKVYLPFSIICLAFSLHAPAQVATENDSLKLQQSVIYTDTTKAYPYQEIAANSDTLKQPDVTPAVYTFKGGIYQKNASTTDEVKPPIPSVTDQQLQARLSDKITVSFNDLKDQFSTIATDSLRARIPQKMPANVTNLKRQISLVTNDTLRAAYYQKVANYYLKYDSISIKKTRLYYQDAALDFTMKALHSYSRFNDTPGLITSFNNLVKVYMDQKKFSQAKWFILQSNTMSRQQKDAPRIISTLVELADIKMAIKDYSLAKRDLNEALALATQNHLHKQESMVQVSFATLYTHLNDPKKAAVALKRHDFLEDSIIKAAAAQRLALLKSQDSTSRVQDSTLQAKKKLYTLSSKKGSKISSSKKTASL